MAILEMSFSTGLFLSAFVFAMASLLYSLIFANDKRN